MFNHLRDAGFNDVGLIAGFVVIPLFRLFSFTHLAHFIYAIRFTNRDTSNMLIQQFFHLFSVVVIIDLLTTDLHRPLAQAGHLFYGFFIEISVLFRKALVGEEGGGLQRYFQASGKGR